jgi:hypothetical protein
MAQLRGARAANARSTPLAQKGAVARIDFSKCGQGVWSWSVVTEAFIQHPSLAGA